MGFDNFPKIVKSSDHLSKTVNHTMTTTPCQITVRSHFNKIVFLILFLSIFLFLNQSVYAVESPIKTDEMVIFLPEIGYPVEGGKQWKLRIHGWIYEPDWTSDFSIMFRTLLGLEEYQLEEEQYQSIAEERRKLFFVDNERGKEIPIRIGDKIFVLGKSESNGHFYGELLVTASEVAQWRNTGHIIAFTAITRENDPRQFTGKVYLLDDQGISVISDIDDTIKVSEVHDKKALLANTFSRPFVPVPKMAEFYQQLATKEPNVTFHYVSASPWQLYPFLTEFLDTYHFPQGSFHLRLFRWKDKNLLTLFKSSKPHKIETIEFLLQNNPHRRFILVGDSGEQDAEIYATFARKYPERIIHIFIHEVPRKEGDQLNYQRVFAGIPPTQWTVFTDATSLLSKE